MFKLLVVEDEALMRHGIINMTNWEEHDIEITGQAANVDEAILLLEHNIPDIIITDIRMPGRNGIELIKHVKEWIPWIQVIVLSSFSDFEYVREALTLGALDYLLKYKMTPKDLLAVIERAKKAINAEDIPVQEAENGRNLKAKRVLNYKAIDEILETLDFNQLMEYTYLLFAESKVELKEEVRLYIDLYYHIIIKLEKLRIITPFIKQNRYLFAKRLQNSKNSHMLYDTFVFIVGEIRDNLETEQYSDLISQVRLYIKSCYAEKLSLKSIAEKFYVSKNYLCYRFKKETGQNTNDYICEVRIEKAKELLKTKKLLIQEVANKVGFDNPNYFSYVFRKNVGMTPMQYTNLFIKE